MIAQTLAAVAVASFTLHLHAASERAFPLFDPVNETKWSPQWHPTLLGDRVEAGLVFLTGEAPHQSVWLLDRYEPSAGRIRYVVTSPAILTTIDIAVAADGPGRSLATVTYRRTATAEDGRGAVEAFAAHGAAHFADWEPAINTVLDAGT